MSKIICDFVKKEPPMSRAQGLTFKSKLDESEIILMREKIREDFDKIQIILKQLSPYMLLVFR
jgi:hypothetical protein